MREIFYQTLMKADRDSLNASGALVNISGVSAMHSPLARKCPQAGRASARWRAG